MMESAATDCKMQGDKKAEPEEDDARADGRRTRFHLNNNDNEPSIWADHREKKTAVDFLLCAADPREDGKEEEDPMKGIGYWMSPGNSPKAKRKAAKVVDMSAVVAALNKMDGRRSSSSRGAF